ncbi:MAG: hypothetical protein VX663_07005, partial [Pseudomonadota bacterium]|nr:hypothetical protein [Pseudomonadota bacterium]
MTEQSSTRSPIRELAWRYYQGEIGAQEYRELRRRQIDAMTGQRTVPDSESRAGGSLTAGLILTVGVIVLAVALALWWFLLRGGDSPGHQLSANDAIPVIASSGALGAVGQRLAANGWEDGTAANFLRQWSQADANIRRIAQTESWYNPLNQIVEDRIDESMALQAAGGDIGPREQFLLSALADALSLPAPEWSDVPAGDTFDTASGLIAREAWPEDLPFVDSAELSTAEPSWQPNSAEQHSATSADPPVDS